MNYLRKREREAGQPGQEPPAPRPVLDATAIDKLIAAHRVIGESRMIRTDTPTDQITDEQVSAVIASVKAYMKAKGVTQAQLARSLMMASSSVSQVLGGKYNADVRPIVQAMDRWLERRSVADEQPAPYKFIWTDTARQIRLAAQRAMAAADAGIDARIALVYGDPGCGKTLALEALAASEDGILITCGVDVSTARSVMEKLAQALNVPVANSNSATFSALVDRLRGSGKLILVDEIHALLDARDDNAFHTLRRLSDQTGCPQVWGATCDLIDLLQQRQHKREPLGQITSRIGSQFNLTAKLHGAGGGSGGRGEPLVSVQQVLEIFGQNELKLTPDAARFLARLCTNPHRGLLRACTNLVVTATAMNRGKATALTAEMLWQACHFLFQSSVVSDIERSLREEISEMKLKLA